MLAFQLTEHAEAPNAPEGTTFITVPAVDGARRTADAVRVGYRDVSGAVGEPARIPLVLLHGSPGSGSVFDGLLHALHGSRRVVVPDLPGFGSSAKSLPDYSFRAHAVYVADLLGHLGIGRAHLLAFSMGGGVGLTMADREPSRVASLVLLSAIGVQEMELLGQYHMNHAVHAAQLAAVWTLTHLVPGAGSWRVHAYARNFYDSDQRPLRGFLERVDAPVLIVHGRRDTLVPVEAAVEHARIVPQAALVVLEGDHFMTFQDPARLAPVVQRFLTLVDQGHAPTRAQAQASRLVHARAPFDPSTVPRVRGLAVAGLAGLGALVALVATPAAWLGRAVATHRRRRLLVSSWRRATRWEFWPPWITYVPVACYVLWLMAKHRSPSVFTAANPAILAGGVVGESKVEILRGLGPGTHVAASERLNRDLSPSEKQARVDRFMRERHLTLPIVVKPDAGQRGSGVVVARTPAELAGALAASRVDTLVQEYVGGEEFGVFYYRRPSESTGHVLSITRKHLPVVYGDGVRTVERLILDDDRAVCMARFHLAHQRSRLTHIPPVGEPVPLGDCGSHCRGALFLDGSALRSPALVAAIDQVAQAFPGFHFGRFDLRAPSAQALAEGRDFKVLELNGVTSEATHIYDPAVSVPEAYRVLFEQWRLAFEIGAENVARGARVTSVLHLARLARQYRRDARHHLGGSAPPRSADRIAKGALGADGDS